jgi:hypothetical protein
MLHLMTSAPDGVVVQVRVDGGQPQRIEFQGPTLYTLLYGESYGEHLLEIETNASGLSLFSATFG